MVEVQENRPSREGSGTIDVRPNLQGREGVAERIRIGRTDSPTLTARSEYRVGEGGSVDAATVHFLLVDGSRCPFNKWFRRR